MLPRTPMDDLDTRTDAPSSQEPTEEALSRLSLVQALRDFEVANARVIDLTERLVATSEELLAARAELGAARAEVEAARAEAAALQARLDDLGARHEALHQTYQRTLARKSVRVANALYSVARRRGEG